MVEYRWFQEIDIREITRCMNRVFSDYPVPIRLTQQQVQGLFYVNGVDLELSWGAFCQGEDDWIHHQCRGNLSERSGCL